MGYTIYYSLKAGKNGFPTKQWNEFTNILKKFVGYKKTKNGITKNKKYFKNSEKSLGKLEINTWIEMQGVYAPYVSFKVHETFLLLSDLREGSTPIEYNDRTEIFTSNDFCKTNRAEGTVGVFIILILAKHILGNKNVNFSSDDMDDSDKEYVKYNQPFTNDEFYNEAVKVVRKIMKKTNKPLEKKKTKKTSAKKTKKTSAKKTKKTSAKKPKKPKKSVKKPKKTSAKKKDCKCTEKKTISRGKNKGNVKCVKRTPPRCRNPTM